MPVTEVLKALGRWTVDLVPATPRDVLDTVVEFGHVAIVPGRIDVRTYGDQLLTAARYVGVVRAGTRADDGHTKAVGDKVQVAGAGMAFWLGDEDDKGSVFESATTFASASFATAITGLLPASGAVTVGTLYSVAGTYTGSHQWETPRKAISYVCDTMSTTSVPLSWRVNGRGTLDAGPETNLYVTTPQCAIVRHNPGEDLSLRAQPGQLNLARDVEDYTTRVVLLAEGDGMSIATGSADISPGANPYKDIHGNTLQMTRMVSESGTSQTNATVRAQLALSQWTSPRNALTLSTSDYDIHGGFNVGDYVWAYDPDKGLLDTRQEVQFRGMRINPLRLQVTETTWPVSRGHTVAYRAADGTWTDLTDYVAFEDQSSVSVTVGNFQRQLTNSSTEPVGSRPNADTSVPGVPTFATPFSGAAYLDNRGFTRSRVVLKWNAPNNADGSTVLDGDHYEIRYAVDTDLIYPATWSQLSQVRWQDLQQWRQPFAAPTGQWQYMNVAWGTAEAQLLDLAPGIGYDVQIRAVDSSGNEGAWSGTTTFVATADNIAPSTPAAPSVAGSRIALQVTHSLGKATGGTFNLESDLHHLEVHVEYEPNFTPSLSTLKGKVSATAGMIQAQIPVVTTVQVEETSARYVRVVAVDIAGNKSAPSTAATATALLIDDAHISDLTVTKVTAGTISADWVVGARIKTADTGARVELNSAGLQTYNSAGTQTVNISASDGSVSIIGQLASGTSGKRMEINPTSTRLPEIRFFPSAGSNYGYINGFDNGTDVLVGVNSSSFTSGATQVHTRAYMTNGTARLEIVRDSDEATYGGYAWADINGFTAGYNRTGANGGKFFADSIRAQVGYMDGTTNQSYFEFLSDGFARYIGEWNYYTVPECGLIMANLSYVGTLGTAGATVTFGATFASTPRVVATIDNFPSGYGCGINVYNTSAVGFDFIGTKDSNGNFVLNYWSWR